MTRRFSRAVTSLLVVSLLAATSAGAATLWATGLAGGSHGEGQSSALTLEATTGANNCFSSVFGATPCSIGAPTPAGPLSSSSSSSATTTLTSTGSANATSATLGMPACGVASLTDTGSDSSWSGSGSNTALAFGGLTYQASGPLAGQAVTTNGSSGWGEAVGQYGNPETFTVLAWFKTSATGSIIGFSNNQTAPVSATNFDRMLWIDPTGHVVWAASTSNPELTSTSTYANGAWHFVAVAMGSTGTQLYVDGTLAGSASAATTAQAYSGWWTVGFSGVLNNGFWGDPPSNAYFNGSLAQVAIIPSQLSSAQISTLYADNTLPTYTAAVNALNPVNDWQLGDSGGVPYEGAIPGQAASTALTDASGAANLGTAQGGVTLGASGPAALGSAISLDGSTGWVQTSNSKADPEGFSIVAWFKTSSSSGGTIIGFTSSQGNVTPATWDRLLWIDNAGKLVWAVNPGGSSASEVTSPSAYNNGQWHMVVAEIGSAGQQLYVDGTLAASNGGVTAAQNYTGYWHLGWGYEQYWGDAPTSYYLTGSLSEVAVIPTQLSASQISTFANASSTAAFTADVGALSPTSYWPLQDSASNVCGSTEVTVQQTVGAANTCIFPSGAGACAAPTSAALIRSLGVRGIAAPTAGIPVTIKITLELSAVSPAGVLGLHELAGVTYASTIPSLWAAQLAYPFAISQL